MDVTALAGGVGGAKLLVGLDRVLTERGTLTAVVNTGDDATIYGTHVSPDVDIVTYWLSGLADTERGWGISGDTFTVVDAMQTLGVDAWFRLGDRDLATCMHRTQRLEDGARLTQITMEIATALGVKPRILPMSDDPVRTKVESVDGRQLDFQEYFVRERCEPEVSAISFDGLDTAKPTSEVLSSLAGADAIVICPSNPLLSIGPILALPGVAEILRQHPRVIAVSPIVNGRALKGPADRLLSRLAGEASASQVARLYASFCNTFVLDESDPDELPKVEGLEIKAVATDTIMKDHIASERLARAVLEL
ncbi:MAG: 2-phospho-L-lactate transferase [Actinomycetota bacterium]